MIEDIVVSAKSSIYNAMIIFISIVSIVLHPIITRISYKPSKHYWSVWLVFSVIILIIMGVLLLAPDWILEVLNSIKGLFA